MSEPYDYTSVDQDYTVEMTRCESYLTISDKKVSKEGILFPINDIKNPGADDLSDRVIGLGITEEGRDSIIQTL